MNNEELIAEYLVGGDVGDELLKRCRKDPELLAELSELVAVDRLLKIPSSQDDEAYFVDEVSHLLQKEEANVKSQDDDEAFAFGVIESIQPKQGQGSNSMWAWGGIAAAALVAIGLWLGMAGQVVDSSNTIAKAGESWGKVTDSVAAKWTDSGERLLAGLAAGRYILESGCASVELNNGVRITLEGPVSFELKDDNLLKLEYGNLVANVPENAIGFSVVTPCAEVVDLGTEFGVAVERDGRSEVHVLSGKVKARQAGSTDFVMMRKNDARVFSVEKQVEIIASQPEKFLRVLPGRSPDKPHFLHWPCDPQGAALECKGTGIGGKLYPGKLLGWKDGEKPAFVNGQFGEALKFNGTSGYVTTEFSGIGGSAPRTVAFWTKVPKEFDLSNGYGMLSWGHFKAGAAWQISVNPNRAEGKVGRIRVGTVSAPVVGSTDLRDNRWHHITVVMYGGQEADVATHILLYVDGQLEQTTRKAVRRVNTGLDEEHSQTVVFGKNMGFDSMRKNHSKFFKGWLDDIYIFDAALSQQQVQGVMKDGYSE